MIQVSNLNHSFDDGKRIFSDIVYGTKRTTVGIIGGNGMGKSTLFSMICGENGLKPSDGGSVELGESVKISYVSQSRIT